MIPGFEDSLKNAIPPAAPASAGGQPLAVAFAGVGRPSSDLAAVRDGRRSIPLGYLVDLSVARSIAAGTALTVPLQGNTFLADPLYDLTGVAQAGIARVHFEGENVTPYDTYVTVLPGAIYRVPFTKVTVENYAQAGKFLYVVYGVDLDLVPGQLQLNDITDRAARLLGVVYGNLGQLTQKASSGLNTLAGTVAPPDWLVDDNRAFMSQASIAAGGAGNVSCSQVKNVAASGKSVYVDGFFVTVGGATGDVFLHGFKDADLLTDNGAFASQGRGGANAVTHHRTQNGAVAPAFDVQLGQIIVPPNDGKDYWFPRPVKIGAGQGYMVQNNTANTSMRIEWRIREY